VNSTKKDGGLVVMAVNKNYNSELISVVNEECVEQLWVKIVLNNSNMYFCCVYLPPDCDVISYERHMSSIEFISNRCDANDKIFVCGDYTVVIKFGHLGRIRTVEYSPKNYGRNSSKMAEFRPKQQKFDLFLAEFRPIFGVEILQCGFAHFWEKFDQNGRNEITVYNLPGWTNESLDGSLTPFHVTSPKEILIIDGMAATLIFVTCFWTFVSVILVKMLVLTNVIVRFFLSIFTIWLMNSQSTLTK
jgi:hypothetical protein